MESGCKVFVLFFNLQEVKLLRLSTDVARVSWAGMGSMSFQGNSMQAWWEHVNSRHKQKSPANVSVLALRKQR